MQGVGGHERPAIAPVLAPQPELVLLGDAVAAALQVLFGLGARRGVHEIVQGAAKHLRAAVAQQVGHAGVGERGAPGGVDQPDAFLRRFDDPAVEGRAGGQGGPGRGRGVGAHQAGDAPALVIGHRVDAPGQGDQRALGVGSGPIPGLRRHGPGGRVEIGRGSRPQQGRRAPPPQQGPARGIEGDDDLMDLFQQRRLPAHRVGYESSGARRGHGCRHGRAAWAVGAGLGPGMGGGQVAQVTIIALVVTFFASARQWTLVPNQTLPTGPRFAAGASPDFGRAPDGRVGEDVVLVGAAGRELGDHGAFVACLEPVQRVGRDGVLLAGVQHDLVAHGVGGLAPRRGPRLRIGHGRAGHVEVDGAPAAAERLFLAWFTSHRRMIMLRAGLAREKYQLLGADAVRIHIDH